MQNLLLKETPSNEERLEELTEEIFCYHREKGFPYYFLTEEEKEREFERLIKCDYEKVLNEKTVKQLMTGLALAWSYFPHAWEVRCNTKHTAYEIFHDDELFRKAIRRKLERGPCRTDADLRKAIRTYTTAQAVSNFRPTAAGAIYEHFAGDGVVWDMSAGFGGRLLGAMTSNAVKTYVGTEPSAETYDGLQEMTRDFFNFYKDSDKKVELIKVGSENYLPDRNSLDLCFTSPPYFDVEKYSGEHTQSYIKFTTQKTWLYKYLGATIRNCIFGLKNDGYIIINIADVSSYRILCNDFERMIIKQMGLKLVTKLDYLISSIYNGGYKSEPLYVFRK
jgi:hypothetical protein